ncbi:MAG: hypothetical protein NTW32_18315 [Chloroflexi bacterium]|nr:hypothetical protein [Chloroflexota bacterium]
MADDITRHLADLSAEIVTENMVSWEQVVAQIETMIEKKSSRYWNTTKLDFIRAVAITKEARLFRAGLSRVYLTISTAQKHGLERGDRFLRLIWNEKNIPVIEYCKFGKTSTQSHVLNTFDDSLFLLMPFLKRLWYESKDRPQPEEANTEEVNTEEPNA